MKWNERTRQHANELQTTFLVTFLMNVLDMIVQQLQNGAVVIKRNQHLSLIITSRTVCTMQSHSTRHQSWFPTSLPSWLIVLFCHCPEPPMRSPYLQQGVGVLQKPACHRVSRLVVGHRPLLVRLQNLYGRYTEQVRPADRSTEQTIVHVCPHAIHAWPTGDHVAKLGGTIVGVY